jgi:uncharacterized oxidoreductase
MISPRALEQFAVRILDAAGSPQDESAVVAETLVRANLAGHDSHGVLRLPQYVTAIREGKLKPGAPLRVVREARAMAVVDGQGGWGPVAARKAMALAMIRARDCSMGTVVARGVQHIGRVGEYVAQAAAENMIGLAFVNSYGGGAAVAPWGGIDGRFAPNPIAFAAPTGLAWPLLVDLTTSVVPEGKVRVAHYEGRPLPPGCIIDAEGRPATDPAVFYGPPAGALLPLGGPVGHKGTGLALIAELLAGILSGAGYSGQADVRGEGNGVFFQAVHIEDFLPLAEFLESVQGLIAWVKSARPAPGVAEVLVPGEPEYRSTRQRRAEGIPLPESVWDEIASIADELGVEMAGIGAA